jgi:hypothetical protein
MNSIPSSNKIRSPSPRHQVKHRKQSVEYVVPSRPKTSIIPAQTRLNVRNAHHKQRFSLPPSIREEDDEDDDDMSMNEPIIIRNNVCQHDDEDEIPLAFLAYRKGYMVPENNNNIIPIIQPSNNNRRKQNLSQHHPNYYGNSTGFTLPVPNKLYHPNMTQQQPRFYQMSDLTHSPSSSNSSLSSVERPPLTPQRKRSTSSSKSYRRQSSHI